MSQIEIENDRHTHTHTAGDTNVATFQMILKFTLGCFLLPVYLTIRILMALFKVW